MRIVLSKAALINYWISTVDIKSACILLTYKILPPLFFLLLEPFANALTIIIPQYMRKKFGQNAQLLNISNLTSTYKKVQHFVRQIHGVDFYIISKNSGTNIA